jgi:hypothetical protein
MNTYPPGGLTRSPPTRYGLLNATILAPTHALPTLLRWSHWRRCANSKPESATIAAADTHPPINTVAVALRRRLGPPSRVIGVVPSDGQRCSRGACGAGYSVFKGRWLANDCLLLIEIACDHHWRATPGGTVAVVPVR